MTLELTKWRAAFESDGRRWPSISIPFELYCAHLSRLGFLTPDLPKYTADVYLAIGCAIGLSRAYDALENVHFPALRTTVRRLVPSSEEADDVLQQLRDRLVVGPSCRIRSYRGNGPLFNWLRMVATNIARDCVRDQAAQRRLLALSQTQPMLWLAGNVEHGASAEDLLAKHHQARMVETGIMKVVGALAHDQRQLLYHHFVSALSIDILACMYGVDRSTVARRIQRTVRWIRQRLRRDFGVDPGLGLVKVNLDATELFQSPGG